MNNLVIFEVLHGLHEQQNENYKTSEATDGQPRRVAVIIEEAHEFLFNGAYQARASRLCRTSDE